MSLTWLKSRCQQLGSSGVLRGRIRFLASSILPMPPTSKPETLYFFNIYFYLFIWLHHQILAEAYGIYFPRAEIEPGLPALEGQSLSHWTTREDLTLWLTLSLSLWLSCFPLFFLIYLFYFWLVFVAASRLSPAAVSTVYSSHSTWASHCSGFFCCKAQALGCTGSVAAGCRLSCPKACGVFPEQGSNLCPLHWKVDS